MLRMKTLLLVPVLALAFAGCGGPGQTGGDAASSAPPTSPPPVSPPPVTPPPVTPPPGSLSFTARCQQPGVIKCVGFDSASDIMGGYGSNSGIFSGATTPALDTSVKASGASSLKFTIPPFSGADTSGSYFTNFSSDLSVQFGENQEFYVQWRQRFSPEFISTNYIAGGGGIKQAILTTGDTPSKLWGSCEAIGVVAQTYYYYPKRFTILYNSCTGSTHHGPYDTFFEPVPNDFKLQNAMSAPFCLYTNPGPGCFGWFPDEWMTFQIRIKTGPRVNDEFVNSFVSLWIAREGQASVLAINWGPYYLTAGPLAEDQKYGKVFLLPYQTEKNPTQNHPTAYTWYDELIISKMPIADPAPCPC
jgi:hypothetical protein